MEKFYEALRESIITQALITVIVVSAWVYMIVSGKTPPQDLTQTLMIVIGFYFGSKVGFRQGEKSIQSLVAKRSTDEWLETEYQKRFPPSVTKKE